MIRILRVISEFLQKSAHLPADSNDDAAKKQTPPSAEPDLALGCGRPAISGRRTATTK
jgi:hypothetical protein